MLARTLVAVLAALAFQGAGPSAIRRPRDPWVFRVTIACVDRAVTVALDASLWTAYDTEMCSLRLAWRGDFGGEARAAQSGARWLEGAAGGVWWLVRDGQARALEPVWRGYAFRGQQATLRYELRHEEVRVSIEETPEFVRPADLADDPSSLAPWVMRDMVGLRLTFRASGIPDGATVTLALSEKLQGNLLSVDLADPIDRPLEGGAERRVAARMPLRGSEAWNELVYFFGRGSGRR